MLWSSRMVPEISPVGAIPRATSHATKNTAHARIFILSVYTSKSTRIRVYTSFDWTRSWVCELEVGIKLVSIALEVRLTLPISLEVGFTLPFILEVESPLTIEL